MCMRHFGSLQHKILAGRVITGHALQIDRHILLKQGVRSKIRGDAANVKSLFPLRQDKGKAEMIRLFRNVFHSLSWLLRAHTHLIPSGMARIQRIHEFTMN